MLGFMLYMVTVAYLALSIVLQCSWSAPAYLYLLAAFGMDAKYAMSIFKYLAAFWWHYLSIFARLAQLQYGGGVWYPC